MDQFALLVALLGVCALVLVLLVVALWRVLRSARRRDALEEDTDPRTGPGLG